MTASRYIANTVILAKTEATPGTDAVPTGAADAVLLCDDVNITPMEVKEIDRKLITGYMGASPKLLTDFYQKVEFSTELAGSGTAGTAPQWGDLFLGCACAEATLATPARVEYSPISTALKTLTQYIYDDGVMRKLLGAMGGCKITARIGGVAKARWSFMGLYADPVAAANATPTLTPWKVPPVINKANTIDITLGATLTAGVLAGGTIYSSQGIDMDLGLNAQYTPFLNEESIDITDRNSTGSLELKLTPAQEVAMQATVKAGTQQSLAFTVGTAAGNKIIFWWAAAQLLKPTLKTVNGVRVIGYSVVIPPIAGNDEFKIVCL